MRRGIVSFALLLSGVGCGAADDAATGPLPPGGTPPPFPDGAERRRWTETFDNRGRLAQLEGAAVLDSNQGRLTLPALEVPSPEGAGERELMAEDARAGLIEGADLVLASSTEIEAPDALELRATGRVVLDGRIDVGTGGLVVVAGGDIVIGGDIESDGPVSLFVTHREAEVSIGGRITLRVPPDPMTSPSSEGLDIRGRGRVSLAGPLDVRRASPVALAVEVYGPIRIESGFEIATGEAARVELGTEDAVELADGADLQSEARWVVQAEHLRLGDGARVRLARMSALAERSIELGDRASVEAGGEELAWLAAQIHLGASSQLLGSGSPGSDVRLEATETLSAAADARVAAGNTRCYGRGTVLVRIAGPYRGLGPARFRASRTSPTDCPEAAPGAISFVAREVVGVTPDLDGAAVRLDPDLRLDTPPIETRAYGRWTSIPFSVDFDARPHLVEARRSQPPGTGVRVLLGRADGPDGPASGFVSEEDGWGVHEGAPWLAVRVELEGGAFDAPTLDHLVIGW